MNDDDRKLLGRLRELDSKLPTPELVTQKTGISVDNFTDDMLPFELYRGKRDNITRIGDQINKAFQFEIFDGCAVLMRRLIEMLLILAYKHQGLDNEILDGDGNYRQLSEMIKLVAQNRKLDLSRNAKEYLESFREKGNLSAHNIFHNARKKDLEILQPKFRHLVEELLYKAGINR